MPLYACTAGRGHARMGPGLQHPASRGAAATWDVSSASSPSPSAMCEYNGTPCGRTTPPPGGLRTCSMHATAWASSSSAGRQPLPSSSTPHAARRQAHLYTGGLPSRRSSDGPHGGMTIVPAAEALQAPPSACTCTCPPAGASHLHEQRWAEGGRRRQARALVTVATSSGTGVHGTGSPVAGWGAPSSPAGLACRLVPAVRRLVLLLLVPRLWPAAGRPVLLDKGVEALRLEELREKRTRRRPVAGQGQGGHGLL